MAKGPSKKVANSLMAASAAAVMAVYAAGYERTKEAASKLDAQFAERRPVPADVRPVGDAPARGPALASVTLPATTSESAPTPDRSASRDRQRVVEKETSAPAPVEVASVAPAPSAVTPVTEPVSPVPAAQPKAETPVTVASVSPAPVAPAVAPPPTPAPAAPATPAPADKPKYKDGTYTGWGTCRHGDIQAQVTIEGGKIIVARISQCLTRYSCDVIGRLPPEVIQRQSAEVDWVTGATQSADAFYYAVTDALSKAK